MLEALKKKLGITDDKNKIVLTDSGTITAEVVETLKKAAEVALNDLGAAESLLSEQTATIATLTQQLKAAQEANEKLNAALAESETAKQEMLANAKAVKMAARKAVIVEAIGDAKADAFLAATENLDDAAFEAVSSALAGSVADEAKTPLFKEVGVDAKADASNVRVESPEMKRLKAMYPQGKDA